MQGGGRTATITSVRRRIFVLQDAAKTHNSEGFRPYSGLQLTFCYLQGLGAGGTVLWVWGAGQSGANATGDNVSASRALLVQLTGLPPMTDKDCM